MDKVRFNVFLIFFGFIDPIYVHIMTSRSMSVPSIALTPFPTALTDLTLLRSLSIDFSHDGLVTQHPVILRLFAHINSTQLTSLTLTALPRIDVPLLKLIALKIPKLKKLMLSSTERLDCACCDDCFNESASRVIHSPIPDMFADVGRLAVSCTIRGFATGALLSLCDHSMHLHKLSDHWQRLNTCISVFYSLMRRI
jgi:hypothetical protein